MRVLYDFTAYSTLYCLLNNYQNRIIYIRYVITDSSNIFYKRITVKKNHPNTLIFSSANTVQQKNIYRIQIKNYE